MRKLNIFFFLESSHQQEASFSQLKEMLGLSDFLLGKEVKELINDIHNYDLEPYFKVTVQERVVKLKRFGSDSVSRLIWLYLKNSQKFLMLDYLFQHNHFTLEKFAKSAFLSTTKTFSIKNDLEEYLNRHHIELDSNYNFIDNEQHIRLFFSQLYFSSYKNYEFPFPDDILAIYTDFSEEVPSIFNTLTCSQELKLKYFLCVNFHRLDFGHPLEANNQYNMTFARNQNSVIVAEMATFFRGHTTLTDDAIRNEIDLLLSFMLAERIISIDFNQFYFANAGEIALTQSFIDLLHRNFSHFTDLQIEDNLRAELNTIHFRYFFYQQNMAHWNPFSNSELLLENYPQFYHFAKTFVEAVVKKETELLEQKSQATLLLNEYVYMLVEKFPSDIFIETLTVTIDFSVGETYNHFIESNLRTLPFFNLTINYNFSKQTDIYLSDLLPEDMNCHYLVWNSPPLATDWEIFGNLVVAIRQEKGAKRHHES